ncbi:MAG TPA: IclR family transcriptional regulator C-terminal domain-containing protein [Edaphobacter sp.]|nr:IclR family transcriptional regulator C-terminal domain-containing protein [Edaphobacter sp.]
MKADEAVALAVAEDQTADAKPRVQSALRAISILLAVSESPNGLKIRDIAEKLRLSRQVTYHLIHTLHATGIIHKNENNRYVLGLASMAIAEGFHRQLAPPEHLARRVRSIVAATDEAAYASGWVDGEIVALSTARGQSPVGAAQIPEGFSGHAHARAAGKLLLAIADREVCENYLDCHPLESRTAKTITDRAVLVKEFQTIREREYSTDDEEFHDSIRCLAVPIDGLGGRFVLGISVPSARFDTNFEQYLAVLKNAARINF